jgi:hypothetical protein
MENNTIYTVQDVHGTDVYLGGWLPLDCCLTAQY